MSCHPHRVTPQDNQTLSVKLLPSLWQCECVPCMACMWILSVLQVYGHHQAKSCITENSGWENKGSVLTIMSNLVMICQHAISRQTRGTTQQGGWAHSTGIPQIKVTQVYKTHYVLANCNDSNLIFSPNILAHDHAPLCQVWLQKTVPS